MPREKPMLRSSTSDADRMSLPPGRTCGDCRYFARCQALFGHIAGDQVCDFSPSAFERPARED